MRTRFIAIVAGFSVVCGAVAAQGADDEASVRALTDALVAAWDAHDAAGWAALFDADAEMILPRGLRVSGQDAIEDGHAGVFATIYQDTTLDISVDHIRFLTPDVALVGFQQTIMAAPGTTPQGSAGQTLVSTMIARQDSSGSAGGDNWLVEYMDSIPAAPADFALPTAENPSPNGE
jgi:uncharacterized protein (TIGR02246 family)